MKQKAYRYKFAMVSFVLLLTLFLACQAVRPFLISDANEVELGNRFKAEILADTKTYPPFKGDARVQRFIDSLGHYITDRQKDRDTMQFTFTIIDDTTINAFAIPGGHVFIYTGLLRAAENSAEVAGVLAHESGHITKYHGVDQMIKSQFVGYINTILFGDSSSIAAAVATLVENMTFLKYSKDNEYQADSCAVAYTTLSNINPIGMKHFLQKLKDRYGDSPKLFEPFSTHPLLSERIKKVQSHIDKTSGAPSDTASLLFTDEYQAMKALLK